MAARENFFLLLDLDPEVDDWAVIEARILEKQRTWSNDKSQGNPKARRRAERSLTLLPEIRAVLKDPETRRAEAREARKRQQEARAETLRELDEAIGLIQSGGGRCDDATLRRLEQRFGKSITRAEIEKRLRAAGVEIGKEAPARKRVAKETIDKAVASTVRRNLDHLGLANLYEFLDLKSQSSPQALCDRAEEIYRENQRLGKTDVDSTARNELAGLCKRLFRDEHEKERYDNSLAMEAMESLKGNLELVGADGFVSRQELDALIRQARQRGVSAEDARAYVEDYAAQRKWGLQQEAELPSEELKLCGFCSALAPPEAGQCPNCGEALEMSCPRCGTANATSQAACTSCGCRIGDAPLVKALLKEGERLVIEGSLAEALRCFDKALLYWPGWPPAIEAKQRLEARRREREEGLRAVEEMVEKRRLVAAGAALERLARQHGGGGLDGLRRRVAEGLKRAEEAFAEGERRRRAGDGDAALDHYEVSLGACADFEPVLAALKASPPPSPGVLAVQPLAAGFRLSWRGADTRRSVAYRVLRKVGGGPQGSEDGACLGEVRGTDFDDTAAPVGEASYYAVFTSRSGVLSHQAAASGPHLRLAEVEALKAVAGDRTVTLSWRRPPGCRRVVVERRSGEQATGGTERSVDGDSLHDAGLDNGCRYAYRIIACFPDPLHPGRELQTAGVSHAVTPVAPPPAVEDLRARRDGRTVRLTWTPPAGARVELRRSSRPPACQPGDLISAAELDRFGAVVAAAAPGSAQLTLTEQGRLFLVPFSITAGTAVAGRAVEVTHLDPVTELSARRAGGGIFLTWTWHPGLKESLVCYGHEVYPEDPRQHTGPRHAASRQAYEREGGWLLRHARRVPHYFSVFACGGEDLYSPPARVLVGMGQTASVCYQVVVKRTLLRRVVEEAWVELICSNGDGGQVLSDLVVVGRAQRVPLSPRDGEVLAEVPALHLEGGRGRIPLPARARRGRPYVKLFFKDAAKAREIRLLPAAQERLRVG